MRARVSHVRLVIIAVATALCVGALVAPAGATDADSVRDAAITSSESVAAASSEGTFFTAAQKVGGADSNADFVYGRSVAVTQDGAAIITGSFQGTAYFPRSAIADDSIALTSAGSSDVFVAALNADGSYFAWATRAGGASGDEAYSVAVTADDTVVITGYFGGTAHFPTGPAADDSIALTSTGSNDVFVAALNTDSSYFAMATRGGGTVGALGRSVAVTPDDTVIITGDFSGTAYFPTGPAADDSIALTSPSFSDVFVAALNVDDSYFAWAVRAGGTSFAGANSVAIQNDDTAIITGSFQGTAYFPKSAVADDSIALTSTGGINDRDVFVAALNADDSYFAWATRAGGTSGDFSNAVTVTVDGTSIITGSFNGTAYFPTGRPTPDDSIALTSAGGSDVFVAALNADGSSFEWAISAGGEQSDSPSSVAVTADDTVIITGRFERTAYFPTGSDADDSIALTAPGFFPDVFVAALNADGSSFAWATRAGGADTDDAFSVAVVADDTAIITGTFEGTAYFPRSADADDSISLTPTGSVDTFVAWLSLASPGPTPDPPAPVVMPPSSPLNVAGEPGDASATISWSSPASAGSFPVTNYQVVVSPGGSSCLVAVPALTCTVSGLTNDTDYTASVRALNGAGWGAFSVPSGVFTPTGPVVSTIVITGSRGEVRGRSGIVVTGATTGFGLGGLVRPWVRLPGQTTFTQGRASILVDESGEFTWQRRVGKRVTVYVETPDGSVRSNRITIPRSGG